MAPLVAVLAAASLFVAVPGAAPAAADTAPPSPSIPATVSADALPTVQINGVVWDQVIVGDRVYATGQFTQARPAGAAPGTNQTPRSNILAYSISTGQLITTWAPTLNQQGMVIERSADGSTIYVGGDFTSVSGQNRQRVVALDAQTGAVRAGFAPVANTRVEAMALVGDTLYLGGYFTTMSGQPRSRLAAVNATNGALLPWAPSVDREVVSMAAAQGRVVAGGAFTVATPSGGTVATTQLGMASFDGTTGAVMPWAINTVVRNSGPNTQIADLHTDGELVFGVAWAFYASGDPIPTQANFEGMFGAHILTGEIEWLNGCRGDNYAVADMGDVLYTAGHSHECGMVDWRPETNPRTWQWANAIDKRGTPGMTNAVGSFNDWQHFDGLPASQMLHWLPTFSPGTYTGNGQAGWSVEANSQYVVYGGEFPRVNGTNQQGLVRFAVRSIAPNNNAIQGFPELTPVVTPLDDGTVRIEWQAAWDRDNAQLTYEVLRGATVNTSTVLSSYTWDKSSWWTRPPLGFVDKTAPPGSTQTYRVRVRDPLGNGFASTATTVTIPTGSAPVSEYHDTVLANGAYNHWRLGEATGVDAYDWANAEDLTLWDQAQRGVPGALLNEADTATNFPGTTSTSTVMGSSQSWLINAADPEPQAGPQVFSIEAWFNTTTTTGGKIVGFGSSRTGRSGSNTVDRHIYMTNDGQLRFGLRPDVGARQTLNTNSPGGYNDGEWHHVVGTLGPDGASLFVDGVQVDSDADLTRAQVYYGYWRVGGDRLSNWPNVPSREAFTGAIDEVAIYRSALTPTQVQANFEASGRDGVFPNVPPTAEFDATVEDLTVTVDATDSNDPDGDIVSYAWDYGDGDTDSGVTPAPHAYDVAGEYTVTLTVTDDDGDTGTETATVTATDPPPNQPPVAGFSTVIDDLTVDFDATTSDDPDGDIVSYDWDFGDGLFGSGLTTPHTYAAAGDYTVTLTVTDDDGDFDTETATVTVTDPPPQFAVDTFNRPFTNGWGTADEGGAWTLAGATTNYSVNGVVGRMTGATGATRSGYLTTASAPAADILVDVALDRAITGNGAYVSVVGRRISEGNDYRLKLQYRANGTVGVFLERYVGGAQTQLTFVANVPGLTMAPNDVLRVRLQVDGTSSTLVRGKVWRATDTEPAAWLVSTTDATPAILQGPGHVGVHFYTSGSWTGAGAVLSVDNLSARLPE